MTHSYSDDFGDFGGRIWLNCAHQGALPRVAVEEAHEAIRWKADPHHLATSEPFNSVPRRVRAALGKLIHCPPEEIILANSTSYGLHLLANGLPLERGDEILVMRGDFPSNILPWLGLEEKGIQVRILQPKNFVLEPEELLSQLRKESKVLCLSWVHSFSGWTVDHEALGRICRERGMIFVLNGSQALGARTLDIRESPVDALVSAGWKWLCGPYATGFCWIRPEVRDSLRYNQAYWLAAQTADDLAKPSADPVIRADLGARKYDIFCTANFFNFKPWAASLEYLLDRGIEQIRRHDDTLVSRLLEGIDPSRFEILSPTQENRRSTLVFLTLHDRSKNRGLFERLMRNGITVALRRGSLRLAPHLYNTAGQIDRVLEVLHSG